MEFLQNLLGRCEYKKINGNRKTTSFGVELDEREEEKGSKEIYQVGGRGKGCGRMSRREGARMSNKPS